MDEVRHILVTAFDGAQVDLDELGSGRITGSIVWSGFGDMDQVDRQHEIRTALVHALGHEATKVGVLLAYTPNEVVAMTAA